MSMKDLVLKNRSYRRFDASKPVSCETLLDLVDLSRYTASGANKQVTRFMVTADEKTNAEVYACLRWAGYYADWDGPVEAERPTGYITLLCPEGTNAPMDEGIKAQTIMLGAVEQGLGGCMLANIDRVQLAKVLHVPEGYKISLVLAIGVPVEPVVLDEIAADGDFKYYRVGDVQHVPKIRLSDVVLGE